MLTEREGKEERATSFSFIHPSKFLLSPLLGELNQEPAGKEKCDLHRCNLRITKIGGWFRSRVTIVLLLTSARFSPVVCNIYIYLYEPFPVICGIVSISNTADRIPVEGESTLGLY